MTRGRFSQLGNSGRVSALDCERCSSGSSPRDMDGEVVLLPRSRFDPKKEDVCGRLPR